MLARSVARSPAAQLPPDDKRRVDPVKDEVVCQRPTTGRTTQLGRRVEKPADPRAGGPSGQHDMVNHNRKHTNK